MAKEMAKDKRDSNEKEKGKKEVSTGRCPLGRDKGKKGPRMERVGIVEGTTLCPTAS